MFLLAAVALFLAQVAGQPPQPAAPTPNASNPASKPPERCSIEGKAVNAVTGEPLKKTHISLSGTTADNIGAGSSVLTGPDGTFILKDLDPGSYRLMATRTGFTQTAYGAKKHSMGGAEIHLAAGQDMKDIVLRLQPQAVVTGRITDSDGDPVANVGVSLARSFYRNGERTLMDAASAMTNDLGEYRIFGVAAGKYRLRAIPRGGFGSTGEQEDYAPTYYPGQPDPQSAALLDIQPGQILRGVDMVVLRTPTRRVRGSVLVTSGRPDIIQVMAMPRDPGEIFGPRRSAMVRPAKPTFEFRLAPGSYNITAYYNESGMMFSGMAQVDVGDSDIDNVAVSVQPGAEISGRLRIEGAGDLSALAQSNVRISAIPKQPMIMVSGVAGGRVNNDDGTFTLKNVGSQPMQVNVIGLPPGYYVKAISFGQQDVKENGLAYTGSNDTLDILVSPNGATVTGVVRNNAGDPVAGATVVLVPPAQQRSNPRGFRIAATDQTGKFSMRGVEPNSYTVFAWEDIEPGQYMDPDVLKTSENQGKPLKLSEGSQESLDLKSIPAEDTPAAAGF